MAKFFTIPTAIGAAKIANSIALNTEFKISHMAIGDGGG